MSEQTTRVEFVAEFIGEGIEEMNEQQRLEEERRRWEETLQIFGNGVEAEAEEFERQRKPTELRMLADMRQYLGVDDEMDVRTMRDRPREASAGSDLNVNITRKKTNTAEARLSDMLFPNDDKNFGVVPSPVPTVAVKGYPKSAPNQPAPPAPPAPPQQPPQQPTQQPTQIPGGDGQPGQEQGMLDQAMSMMAQGQPPAGDPAAAGQQPAAGPGPGPQQAAPPPAPLSPEEEAERDAKARAMLMEKTIEDQLTECQYNSSGREAIRYGCLLGTGVIKGPVLLGRSRRMWAKIEDDMGNVAYVLKDVEDNNPGFEWVSTWDFFPTMSATRIEDSEVTFQRHWMTRRDLIRLAKREDFLKDQIRKVLRLSPDKVPPDYLTQLRSMSNVTTSVGDEKRYIVWERHGPIPVEALQAAGVLEKDAEIDPLDEYQGVVWVCQGIVIKAAINPMDTEDQPFSVFNFEKDDASIFGYGVPYLMRQPQKVVRRAWQMIMDNAGLSVGGQIIINKAIIEPAPSPDGMASWSATPLKIWLLKDKHARAQDAFHVFEFPNHQQELAAIFNLARELADEETGIPVIAQGEQGANVTQTAHGMELLMNNHNIVMRRAVKNWDDHVTIPAITRLYDWNMQNNPNNDIKGDFTPVAKGSTALLQKETQARNMLNLVNFLMTPAFAGWVKQKQTVDKLVAAMQHDPEELIKTQAEYDADMAKQQEAMAQQQQQGANAAEVQRMKNDLAFKIHQDKLADRAADRQFQALIKEKEHEIEMMKMAQAENTTIAKIQGQLTAIREKTISERTLKADEFKMRLNLPSGKVEG